MIVLALDTATAGTAVALRGADGSLRELRDDPPPGGHPGHATRLLAMAAELLAEAATPWNELERLATGVGPGTFTGLRVGVATARGLAQSLGCELVGVSSLAALAAAALAGEDAPEAVLAAIDARRGEVFAAVFAAGRPPRRLTETRALPPERLISLAGEAGLDPARLLAVGDGAERYRGPLGEAGLDLAPAGSPLHRVAATEICVLGEAAAPAAPHELVPDYGRRPDAELALETPAAQRRAST